MDNKTMQTQTQIDHEIYMKVWDGDQAYQRYRWTIVTFFIGVSFAILGLSFQTRITAVPLLFMRLFGISIYWFAYGLYSFFYGYTTVFRKYLKEMEESGKVSINLQTRFGDFRSSSLLHKVMSAKRFLLLFGALYTFLVVIVWLLGY